MASPKDSARQLTQISEMMERLGIDSGETAVPRLSLIYTTAFHRCEACPAKQACREWLDSMPRSMASAPRFCPNADLLFELRVNQPGRSSIIASDHHAHIADLERFEDEVDDLLLQKATDDPMFGELRCRKNRLRDEIERLRREAVAKGLPH